MCERNPSPRHYAQPVEVITDIVGVLEPGLSVEAIGDAIASCAKRPSSLRKLARAIDLDADLLTSGRPEGPLLIQKLIGALLDRGAVNVVRPRCARCGGQKPLKSFDENGLRVCPWCDMQRNAEPCTGCGSCRHVPYRDTAGRPFCRKCWQTHGDGPADPVAAICDAVCTLEPGLDRATVADIARSVAVSSPAQRKLAVALQANPAVLTGQAHTGPPQMPKLVDRLIAAGAGNVIAPKCPFCQENRTLKHTRDGQRCCRRCWDHVMARPCTECGRKTPGNGRDAEQRVLCAICVRADPVRFQQCSRCGRTAYIAQRVDEQRICGRCYRPPMGTCSRCGRTKPCHLSSTDSAICLSCEKFRRPPEPCAMCGKVRLVKRRRDDGRPVCAECNVTVAPCALCGHRKKVLARLPTGEALCRSCYAVHPAGRRICIDCGVLQRLRHHGLCNRCACRQLLTELLSHGATMQPHIVPIFEALFAADSVGILNWLRKPEPREVLRVIGAAPSLVTHDFLDELGPPRSVAHIRGGLVASGVLPPRDEGMIALQNTIDAEIARLDNVAYARVVRSFATWHHLRRLRRRLGDEHVKFDQIVVVRREVKAAVDLLDWLTDRQVTLAECRHSDIDDWLTDGPWTRYLARTFLSWSTKNGHAPKGLKIPMPPRDSVPPHIDADARWSLVRRLLHDESIDTVDRVGGLLILLYAQPLTRIVHLTVDQVSPSGDSLMLGETPVLLPPPIDALVDELRQQRHGRALIGRTADNPWLFPGGRAGRPLAARQLMRRLQVYGIRARPARNTTLMELANQLPAVVISRLLGLHAGTATKWSVEAGNPRADYAAELAARSRRRTAPPGSATRV